MIVFVVVFVVVGVLVLERYDAVPSTSTSTITTHDHDHDDDHAEDEIGDTPLIAGAHRAACELARLR